LAAVVKYLAKARPPLHMIAMIMKSLAGHVQTFRMKFPL